MNTRFSQSAVAIVDAFWAQELCCRPEELEEPGIGLIECPSWDGSPYAHLLWRLDRLQIACSPSLFGGMRELVGGRTVPEAFNVAKLELVLAERVVRIVGPTFLGYRDLTDVDPPDPCVRRLDPLDTDLLDQFRAGIAARDWEYSGLEVGQPIMGYIVNGRLLAAAGYEVWGRTIAHIGVVTHSEFRGRGFGSACVRHIANVAISEGLIAQYQTLFANEPAMAVGRSLGFEEYGQRIFVHGTAAEQTDEPERAQSS
jgi:GNAT superfamily N-acetyltransferase